MLNLEVKFSDFGLLLMDSTVETLGVGNLCEALTAFICLFFDNTWPEVL